MTFINNYHFEDTNHKSSPSACAIVAPALKGQAMTIKKFSNYKALLDEFGDECDPYPLVTMAKVLFLNNVSTIYCIAPSINTQPTLQNYIDAFKILQCTSGFYCIVCDSFNQNVLKELTTHINIPNNLNLPRLAFAPTPYNLDEAIALQKQVANPKLTLAFPQTCLNSNPNIAPNCLTATALAALIATAPNPTTNLSGAQIFGLSFKTLNFNRLHLNKLAKNHISCLKPHKGNLEVYNLTPSESISPKLLPNINHQLILDSIITDIINHIEAIKKSKAFNFITKNGLLAQVIALLSNKKELGLISYFEKPTINITSSINIGISITLSSLFDTANISTNISI